MYNQHRIMQFKHPPWSASQFDGQILYMIGVESKPENGCETLLASGIADPSMRKISSIVAWVS